MNAYIIAYDIDTTVVNPKTSAQVYSDVREIIESFSVYGQLTESCWLLLSTRSHVEIRDLFKGVMRPCDRLLVVKSARVAAWQNLKKESVWVKEHI